MKSILMAIAISLLSIPTFAAPPPEQDASSSPTADTLSIQTSSPLKTDTNPEGGEIVEGQYTLFNNLEVPRMKELDGASFNESIKEGYWFVKHYSPYCGHCQAIAPMWQTLYEFYYTSNPLPSSSKQAHDHHSSLNSFHGFYNFHFASLDCIAFGETCEQHGVKAWPSFLLYQNGEFVEKYTGEKTMEALSHYIEEKLEQIRPGSRSREGVKLPEPGATKVDTASAPGNPLAKDKDAAAGVAAGEKHNEQAAQLATKTVSSKSTTATSKTSKAYVEPSKPKKVPNPLGTSVPLTAESFQRLVTTTQDPWFIEFYAPWCPHCQALAPNWSQMAKEMQGKLNVGQVNCDAEARLCKDVRVKGYPTIHFFRGGERVEYDGLRGLGDLISYANKALDVGLGVQYVDATTFKDMEETEEVIFVYFYDHATTTEDFDALERLTLSLIGHGKIVKTDSALLAERFKISTWPRLLVSRDGRPSYYTALAPKDMRDFRRVLNWMQSVWLPIVPELTASNAREVMDGRYVVLGILTRQRPDEFAQDRRELKNAALEWMDKQTQAFQRERQELRDSKQLRIEEAEDRNDQRALRHAKQRQINIREDDKKQVGFAWVDGVFWERWIRTTYGIDVRKGERVIINDEDNRRYWDETSSGAYIVPSRTSILDTLPQIVASPPKLTPKSTIGAVENAFFQARGLSTSHPWASLFIIVSLVAAGAIWGRGRIRKAKGLGTGNGGFFHLDGKEGLLNGGGAGGKVD